MNAALPYDNESLYEALKELDVIDTELLNQALSKSKKDHIPLEDILVSKDLISDENIGRTIADLLSLPLIRLNEFAIPSDILHLIPEQVAKKQRIIVFKKDSRGYHVAMNNPFNLQLRNFLEKRLGRMTVYYATKQDIEDALFLYTKDLSSTFQELIKDSLHEASGSKTIQNDPPIIKIVDMIFIYAYQNRASDVHIEPLRHTSLIRFRIDGILHDVLSLPLELHKPVVTRIKVLANLRTDEHQAPQDGKIQFPTEHEELDVRVSIVPITGGEKIVARLLSERSRQFSLADLGFSDDDLDKVKEAYEKPYGMILSTGPTGSGKTTTIYAVLKLLNKRDVNIMTIEDPVEYEIEGVNHIQVNTKTNLTFAEGLRSIVRQDPNIVFVGEIRDGETADIAINSAMTGHLVLSTLHTNDATTTIPRLFDLDIEPFLVSSTVNVIIAQRLVRKIHTRCRVSEMVDAKELTSQLDAKLVTKVFGDTKSFQLYRGKGCEIDHGIGYDGRVGIFEVLVVSDEMRKAIAERKDTSILREIAIRDGMRTMLEDGLKKAKAGVTTIEEILRVTKE